MDARRLIRESAEDENYFLGDHCLEEMDKDGLSSEQVETVMIKGTVRKRNIRLGRYTLSYGDIIISVETRPDSKICGNSHGWKSEREMRIMARPTCSCGATMEAKTVSVVRSVGGRTVTIQNVPALVCPRCDTVMYRASTVKTMDLLIRGNPDKATLIYPEFQDHTTRILIQLSAGDPAFSQDRDRPVRRYDLARLKSYLPRLTTITR